MLDRFPTLSVALSEGQVGWIPYLLERLDQVWNERPVYGNLEALTKPPSAYFREQVFGCVYDDVAGLRLRDTIGMSQIMFEVDYPHGDSTWPNTRAVAEKIAHRSRTVRAGAVLAGTRQRHPLLRAGPVRHHRLTAGGLPAP